MEKNNMRHEVWRSLRDGDFQEDDVWDVLGSKPSFSSQTSFPSEPIVIPKRQSRERMSPTTRQHSVPVSVPDWSVGHTRKTKKVDDGDDDDYDDDDDEEKVSPKEYFLRRSQSSCWSSSVMEGVGRKLKGRDLSKVRNAILKKTGFLE